MIINNLLTYGLRMRVNQAVLGSLLLLPLARDDVITLLAIPLSGLLFALVALLIEKLGLMLLRSQEKVCGCVWCQRCVWLAAVCVNVRQGSCV